MFLTPDLLIVPSSTEATLEVFRIPTSGEGQLAHVFRLPELRAENSILSFQCRGDPNPRALTRRPSRAKFPSRPEDAVLIFTFETSGRTHGTTQHIFIVNRALFCATLQSSEADVVEVEWEAWGPRCTRWIDAASLAVHHITVTCGQRMVSIPHHAWRIPAPIRVLDFNPRHVQMQRAVGPVEGEHATIRVVEDTQAPDWLKHLDTFKEPVISLLPYVEIVSKEDFDFGAVLINDENILGVRVSQYLSLEVSFSF